MSDQSLWGAIPLDVRLETPLSILKQQAAFLTEATNGLLNGRVMPFDTQKAEELGHVLRVVAPALAHYFVPIASISHRISLYPVRVFSDVSEEWVGEASDPDQLRALLKSVFQSDETHTILRALISQSTDEGLLTRDRKRRPRVELGGGGEHHQHHGSHHAQGGSAGGQRTKSRRRHH